MVCGIHEFLPQGATYITIFREPVAGLLSAYSFILRRPVNPIHRRLKSEQLDLEDEVRGARVLAHLLPQLLHSGLERRHTGCQVQEKGLRFRRGALPDL